jgi:hypothetical protein
VTDEPQMTPEIFDQEFTKVAQSRWVQSVFAEDLPDEIDPFSFVTLSGLEEIVSWFHMSPGSLLVDLACGRGGPGNDDPGLKSLSDEAERVLPIIDLARRVLGIAERPDR